MTQTICPTSQPSPTSFHEWVTPESAAGISAKGKGKQKEKQVPLISYNKLLLTTPQYIRGSTSAQVKEEPIDLDVDYKYILQALLNVLNKIKLHTQSCEKCKH